MNSFMESEEAEKAFRELFLVFGDRTAPVAKLSSCPQWQRSPDDPEYCRFLKGYLFNFSTQIPTEADVFAAFAQAASHGLDGIVVPNVRATAGTDSLERLGFQKNPAGDECVVELGRDLDTTMRSRLGSRGFADLRRYQKKAHREFNFETYSLGEIMCQPDKITGLDRVFAEHESRYGHQVRLFGKRFLECVAQVEILANRTRIGLRCSQGGQIVQAMIWMDDPESRTSYYLAQAIDVQSVNRSHNLYKAAYLDLYRISLAQGFSFVNVGRGNTALKRKLGVNIVIPQFHWIYKISGQEEVTYA